ncbi:response regulator [Pleurocapsales cyanobacterium LEGE 10410]|nr:response regulator [Pleurocapsales cyanobacterium LEGE 10410]
MNKRSILVIEDDTGIQAVTKFSLEMDNHWQVVTANNGTEGVFQASNMNPDVILLDLVLPDISGRELLRKLQTERTTSNIPIVLFTAKSIEGEVLRIKSSNVIGLISKPFDCLTLSSQILDFLAHREQFADNTINELVSGSDEQLKLRD